MSLLDETNAVIKVFPQVLGTDPDGGPQWKPSEVGVDVPVMAWPVSTDELAGNGQRSGETYRVRPKRGVPFPAGPWALVEWQGRTWDVDGEPAEHRRGRGTRRTTVTIQTQNPRPEV